MDGDGDDGASPMATTADAINMTLEKLLSRAASLDADRARSAALLEKLEAAVASPTATSTTPELEAIEKREALLEAHLLHMKVAVVPHSTVYLRVPCHCAICTIGATYAIFC